MSLSPLLLLDQCQNDIDLEAYTSAYKYALGHNNRELALLELHARSGIDSIRNYGRKIREEAFLLQNAAHAIGSIIQSDLDFIDHRCSKYNIIQAQKALSRSIAGNAADTARTMDTDWVRAGNIIFNRAKTTARTKFRLALKNGGILPVSKRIKGGIDASHIGYFDLKAAYANALRDLGFADFDRLITLRANEEAKGNKRLANIYKLTANAAAGNFAVREEYNSPSYNRARFPALNRYVVAVTAERLLDIMSLAGGNIIQAQTDGFYTEFASHEDYLKAERTVLAVSSFPVSCQYYERIVFWNNLDNSIAFKDGKPLIGTGRGFFNCGRPNAVLYNPSADDEDSIAYDRAPSSLAASIALSRKRKHLARIIGIDRKDCFVSSLHTASDCLAAMHYSEVMLHHTDMDIEAFRKFFVKQAAPQKQKTFIYNAQNITREVLSIKDKYENICNKKYKEDDRVRKLNDIMENTRFMDNGARIAGAGSRLSICPSPDNNEKSLIDIIDSEERIVERFLKHMKFVISSFCIISSDVIWKQLAERLIMNWYKSSGGLTHTNGRCLENATGYYGEQNTGSERFATGNQCYRYGTPSRCYVQDDKNHHVLLSDDTDKKFYQLLIKLLNQYQALAAWYFSDGNIGRIRMFTWNDTTDMDKGRPDRSGLEDGARAIVRTARNYRHGLRRNELEQYRCFTSYFTSRDNIYRDRLKDLLEVLYDGSVITIEESIKIHDGIRDVIDPLYDECTAWLDKNLYFHQGSVNSRHGNRPSTSKPANTLSGIAGYPCVPGMELCSVNSKLAWVLHVFCGLNAKEEWNKEQNRKEKPVLSLSWNTCAAYKAAKAVPVTGTNTIISDKEWADIMVKTINFTISSEKSIKADKALREKTRLKTVNNSRDRRSGKTKALHEKLAKAAKLCKPGVSIRSVAADLKLSPQTLRDYIKKNS